MSLSDVLPFLQLGGTVSALVFFLVALLRGWVVPRSFLEEVIRDRNEWKEIALTGTTAAERGLKVAQEMRDASKEGVKRIRRSRSHDLG